MVDVTLEKSMPNSKEAEQMILGCSILDNQAFEQAAHALDPEMFYQPSHRLIFAAMAKLHLANKGIDPVTLADELHRSGDLDRVGGPAFIASLFDGVPRFPDIGNYVRIVREKFQSRMLAASGSQILNRALDDEMEVDEQLRLAERQLLEITNRDTSAHWTHIAAAANNYLAKVEERSGNPRPVVGFSTGFRDLDWLTLGLEKKRVNLIAARPGVAKTAFALALTDNISSSELNRDDAGNPPSGAWFSFEMDKEQLAQRLISGRAGVPMRDLHLGRINKDQWRDVVNAEKWLASWRVHVDDRCGLSIPKMREAIRQLRQSEKAVDFIVVDYIQLGDGSGGLKMNRAEEVGAFSRGLMQMAKDYDICVIGLSQVNRMAETRGGSDRGRVSLGDLRESGQLEQDAYMVWGLYREAMYKPDSIKPNSLEVDILKQRNGPAPATVELYFDPTRMKFGDAAREGDYV